MGDNNNTGRIASHYQTIYQEITMFFLTRKRKRKREKLDLIISNQLLQEADREHAFQLKIGQLR